MNETTTRKDELMKRIAELRKQRMIGIKIASILSQAGYDDEEICDALDESGYIAFIDKDGLWVG